MAVLLPTIAWQLGVTSLQNLDLEAARCRGLQRWPFVESLTTQPKTIQLSIAWTRRRTRFLLRILLVRPRPQLRVLLPPRTDAMLARSMPGPNRHPSRLLCVG